MSSNKINVDSIIHLLKNTSWIAIIIVFGLTIIYIAQFTDAFQKLWMLWENRKAALKPVEVMVIDDREELEQFIKKWLPDTPNVVPEFGSFPLIDLKLLNSGKTTVYLKRVNFKVKRIYSNPYFFKCAPVRHSWVYNVLLDADKNNAEKSIEISQAIKSNEVDRFVISVGHSTKLGMASDAEYEISLKLIYDQNSYISLGKHRIKIHGPGCGWESKLDDIRWIRKM